MISGEPAVRGDGASYCPKLEARAPSRTFVATASVFPGVSPVPLDTIAQSPERPEAGPAGRCRVAVVEDIDGVRAEIAAMLDSLDGFVCAAACASAEEALKRLPGVRPDVVLMDIYLARMTGIECTARLKEALPGCQIVILTASDDEELIFPALEAGADGYLLKTCPPEELRRGLAEVRQGGVPMTGGIARRVAEFFRRRAQPADETRRLSQRETEVLGLIARGFGNKEIADRLSLSVETVRSYLKNIYEKMHVHSRAEAVAKFMGGGDRAGRR